MIPFSKYHGLGNDFLIVDSKYQSTLSHDDVISLCDRHTGVGADGVLFVNESELRMDIVNSDGSVPEMCGNGLRCVVHYLVHQRNIKQHSLEIATAAGPHTCDLVEDEVSVAMRPATLAKATIPVVYRSDEDQVVNQPFEGLEYKGKTLNFTCVSMGNPHAVTFDVPKDDVEARLRLGPEVAASKFFPEGVNVSFASIEDGVMHLSVFERGAGWTQACGTGACAAAIASVQTGRIPASAISVRLPGGMLSIEVPADLSQPVNMRGPAAHIFDGKTTDFFR